MNPRWMRLYSHALSLTSTEACAGGGGFVAPEQLVTGAAELEMEREMARIVNEEIEKVVRTNRRPLRPVQRAAPPRGDEESVSVHAWRGGLPGLGRRR